MRDNIVLPSSSAETEAVFHLAHQSLAIVFYLTQLTTFLRSTVIRRELEHPFGKYIKLVKVAGPGVAAVAPLKFLPLHVSACLRLTLSVSLNL